MKRFLITAALLVPGLPAAAHAEGQVVETCVSDPCVGEAAIDTPATAASKKNAREQALEAAIRDALVKGAGAEIDSATETEGGTLLQDRIFMHANGYVKGYQIEDDREDDGAWRVKLSHVKVGTGDLSRDVQAVKAEIARQGHPRIYPLIREQSIETVTGNDPTSKKGGEVTAASVSQGVVEQGLVEHLRPLGWKFVDPEVASGKVHVANVLTTDLQNLNGRDFATTGADYVILGSVVVRPEKAGAATGSALSSVLLRTVLYVKATDTGDTVASVEKSSTVSSAVSINAAATKALEQAGGDLAQALQKQVLETWRANRNGVGKVMLSVAVADYDVLQAFEEQLQKGVANVKAVDEVSYNDGKAEIAVSMAGTSPKQLAGSLSNKSVKGMQVKVTRVTTNTVEVKLVK